MRRFQGMLKGTDVHTNIILSNAVERLFSVDEGVEMVPLGLYLIRGENMFVSIPSCTSSALKDFKD